MSSIRFRLLFAISVTTATILGFGNLCLISFNEYKDAQEGLRQSFYLQDQVRRLSARRFNHSTFEDLKFARATINPEHRAEALSDVIQSYGDRNPATLSRRVNHFIRNEKEYRKFQIPLITYFEKRIEYFSFIVVATMLGTLLLLYVYVRESIFREIDSLSHKMIDFLNHKYTYQFALPAANEMGDLQATFNSLAQKVLSQMDELKSLDRAKSDFLSIASHELRTPLTSIKGSLSLLKTGIVGQLNEAANNLVNIAESETDRLIRLINDLLDLAKIDAHRLPLTKQWCPLQEVIKSSLDGIQGLAKTAGVRLIHNEIPPVEAHMDKDRIQQVLMNLISNAIKYSPRNAVVQIGIEIDDVRNLVISVSDQGKGIAPEDQDLIFQKFRQVTSSENPLVKGTGLGLAIAKALVEEHQGMIGVQSSPSQGSTFYFTLGEWRFNADSMDSSNSATSKGAAA